jgi:thioredoxin 1
MRVLILVLALGVSYASTLAGLQAVAQEAPARTVNAQTYQLVDEDQRVDPIGKPVARRTGPGWYAVVNAAESTLTPGRPGTGAPAQAAGTQGTTTTVAGNQTILNGGWVNGCPCSDACSCIDPAICKAGDCKRNYIVLFTAKWCKFCPRQKAICDQLSKDGYIVHIIDYDTHKAVADELRVTQLPTTLVFNDGKEAARYAGLTRADQITAGVKKKADQKDPPAPKPDPYDFSS